MKLNHLVDLTDEELTLMKGFIPHLDPNFYAERTKLAQVGGKSFFHLGEQFEVEEEIEEVYTYPSWKNWGWEGKVGRVRN